MKRVIIASKIEDNSIYNLAKRLVKFIQDYDWYDYADSLEIGETEEDAIESMVDSLSDKKGVQSILNTLNDIVSDDSDVDKAVVEKLIDDISLLQRNTDVSSATILASDSTQKPYLYILTHGFSIGTLPKGVSVVQGWDLPNGYVVVALDRFLTTKELQEYDIPSETNLRNKLSSAGYDYYYDGEKYILFDVDTEEVLEPFRDDSKYF